SLCIPPDLDAHRAVRTLHRHPAHQYHRSNRHSTPPLLTDQHAPAVSSLEDCPTPTLWSPRARVVARTRAGVGQSLTKEDLRGRQSAGTGRLGMSAARNTAARTPV